MGASENYSPGVCVELQQRDKSEQLLGAPGPHRSPCSLSGGYSKGPREEKWSPQEVKRGPGKLGVDFACHRGYPGGLEGAGHWPCAFLGCSKPIPFVHLERTRPSALLPESAKQLGQSDLLVRPTGGSYCSLALCLEALLTLPSYPLGGHLSLGIKDGSVELWLCPLLHVSPSILAFRIPEGLSQAHRFCWNPPTGSGSQERRRGSPG